MSNNDKRPRGRQRPGRVTNERKPKDEASEMRTATGKKVRELVIWDHREPVDVAQLNGAIQACLARHGKVWLTEAETGSDEFAIVVSPETLTARQAAAALSRPTNVRMSPRA